ncbi:BTB/POZ domain-containing protein 1 [Orchesella cincta]|uniref:BTB/POZ domain-containing protein 1 n=1 Tax=Orchesella cincta TaxID=48709 RepID=A0A1D2N4N2_ORCCI|nr:BTB/POZ domain-containing protein 1 [Orchesella cincta]
MAGEYDEEIVVLNACEGDHDPRVSRLPQVLFREWKTRLNRTQSFECFLRSVFRTGKCSDVKFIFKENQRVFGHKSVLASKSEVFSAMFSDRWNRNDEIDLSRSGVDKNDFEVFMEFLYVGHILVSSPNVLALYHLADMYRIDELKEKCEAYLRDHIDGENIFTVLNSVLAVDFARTSLLLGDLISFMYRCGEAMLDRKELQELSQTSLQLIFSRGQFECSPLKVLRFCLGWMIKNRGRSVLRDLRELDKMMEEQLSFRHRHDIPRLWFCSYTHCCVGPNIVSPNKEHFFNRFDSCSSTSGKLWTYRPHHPDRLSFRVSDMIELTGIGLFGDSKARVECSNANNAMHWRNETLTGQKYHVELKITPHGQHHNELMLLQSLGGSDVNRTTKTFKVELKLKRPLILYPNQWYTVHVSMMGPPSYFGQKGNSEKVVICGGVPLVFEFKDADNSKEYIKTNNATGPPIGQIPTIYFKIPQASQDDDDIQIL